MSLRYTIGICPSCRISDALWPFGDDGSLICEPCKRAQLEPLADEAKDRVRAPIAEAAAQLRRLG